MKGVAPDLVRAYPPYSLSEASLEAAALQAVEDHEPVIRAFLQSSPQTNEVGRAGVLVGGFLEIAAKTGSPLRTLEIGASAGLNSVWDTFDYRLGGTEWGDPQSAVRLDPVWQGPAPVVDATVGILERHACDVAPIDLSDAEQWLRLKSYVWADQPARMARLEGAMDMARRMGIHVEKDDAADWVEARLAEPVSPCTTVLFHSIMWQYMPASTQAAILESVTRAGSRATETAALAWLRFEPVDLEAEPHLRLTLWPGGRERTLARAHPHGSRVIWLGRD